MKRFLWKAAAVTGVVVLYGTLLSVAFAEHGGATLNAEPEISRAPINTKVHIKATLSSAAPSDRPVNIDAEVQDAKTTGPSGGPTGGSSADSPNDPDPTPASPNLPDYTCEIPAGQQWCWFSHSGDTAGTDEICVWVDEDFDDQTNEGDCGEYQDDTRQDRSGNGDDCNDPASGDDATPPIGEPDCTDVVQVIWSAQATEANSLDCDDATGPDREKETNTNDQSETYTCRLRDAQGARGPEGTVYAEVENNINDPDPTDDDSYDTPDYFCVANNSGTDESDCTITVTQAEGEAGTAEICFWSYGTGAGEAVASDSGLCGSEPTAEGQTSTQLTDVGNDMADQVELTWSAQSTSTTNTTTTGSSTTTTRSSTTTTTSRTTTGMTTPPGQTTSSTTTTPEDERVATNLTIRYRRGLFSGSAGSSKRACQRGRLVTLKKHTRGPNKTIGKDRTDRSGNWKIRKRARRGRYYAVVATKVYTAGDGHRVVCQRDKSATIRTRR